MIKALIVTLLIVAHLFALVDLGKIGPVSEIKEPDMLKQLKKAVKNYRVQDIEEKLQASAKALATVNTVMTGCLLDEYRETDNIRYSKVTHYGLDGVPLVRKGDEIKIEYPTETSVCVVDGSNMEIAISSMNKLNSTGTCNKIMIANRDFREVSKLFPERTEFYPFHKELSDIAYFRCMPSRSILHKGKVKTEEYKVGLSNE